MLVFHQILRTFALTKMPQEFCTCLYKIFIDESGSTLSTVLEFLFSIILVVCGVTLNYRFLKNLQTEKRNTPLGRKGNVIEPIMRWFCVIQMIYWPYHLSFFWIESNEIIPVEYMNGWWCNVCFGVIKFGRVCIAFNSIFVALIRYIYIIYQKKSNQWEFENVGRSFQIASVAVPIVIETIGLFTYPYKEIQNKDTFKQCIAVYQGHNNTDNVEIQTPYLLEWTLMAFPEWMVLTGYYIYSTAFFAVGSNAIEGILYFQIFRSINK